MYEITSPSIFKTKLIPIRTCQWFYEDTNFIKSSQKAGDEKEPGRTNKYREDIMVAK